MTDTDPYAPFRPQRGRVVPMIAAGLSVVVFVVIALSMPGDGPGSWATPDRVMLIVFGLLIAAFLWRYARVRAIPTEKGLEVHNLFAVRYLDWRQIVNVQFGGGAAWASLELDDTETVAVMAIQRADGERSVAESQRLAALVEANSQTSHGS